MIKVQDPKKIILAKKREKVDNLRVLLDLDGVVANWTMAACKACGLDYGELKEELKKEDKLENLIDEDEMWKKIDAEGEGWWTGLELFPWAKKLYNELEKKTSMLCFLTAPARNEISLAGKAKWIKKHFDTTDFLIGKPKYFCANKNSLLIDDTKKRTDKFKEHGGNAFLWPNPNKLLDGDIDVDDTINELMEYINELEL